MGVVANHTPTSTMWAIPAHSLRISSSLTVMDRVGLKFSQVGVVFTGDPRHSSNQSSRRCGPSLGEQHTPVGPTPQTDTKLLSNIPHNARRATRTTMSVPLRAAECMSSRGSSTAAADT